MRYVQMAQWLQVVPDLLRPPGRLRGVLVRPEDCASPAIDEVLGT